ncbi:MAG: hypothetical protein U9Q06_02865 [Nanoarchaeota archaeon]|nr:hypothetical protein [Nanoarchaeota archaeon]
MKWNAFSLIEPAIKKTEGLLFGDAFSLKYWMKLGFVSMFSMNRIGGGFKSGGGGRNFTLPSTKNERVSNITGNAVSKFSGTTAGIVGLIAVIGLMIGLIFNYITSMFTFVFIDALFKKQYSIRQSWGESRSKGCSLFFFRIIIAIITFGGILLIFSPLIIQIASVGIGNYFENFNLLFFIGQVLLYLLLLVVWVFLISIFLTFVYDFSLVDVYTNSIGFTSAIRRTFHNLRDQKLEGLVYWLAKLVIGIVTGMAVLLLGIIYLVLLLFVGGLLGLIILLPVYLISKSILAIIALSIILGIPFLLLAFYLFNVLVLPLSVFVRYFAILGYEKLYGKKVLS